MNNMQQSLSAVVFVTFILGLFLGWQLPALVAEVPPAPVIVGVINTNYPNAEIEVKFGN